MINPNAGAAFLVMALSGCATCPPTTVYKLATANEVSGVSSHTDWENRTVLVIEPDIRLVINTCWENGLCVTASLPEGRRMRFTSNEFVEVDEGSGRVINTHRPSLISYTTLVKPGARNLSPARRRMNRRQQKRCASPRFRTPRITTGNTAPS